MPSLLEEKGPDPNGLLEYSVVYSDRALNHMSQDFQGTMRYLSKTLKKCYNADETVIIPGSGTYAMEAVARQFANGADKKVLILRNGWFSYRWTQIIDTCKLGCDATVLCAQPVTNNQSENKATQLYEPHPIEQVVATIEELKPAVVFAPHVETSAGMILPDDYIAAVGAAAKKVGALFVLDAIAAGCVWSDMKALNVDVLISAPQKGWTGLACSGLVMMNTRAYDVMQTQSSNSFAVNLAAWSNVMHKYENGGHAYYTTLPTDALRRLAEIMKECEEYGFDKLKHEQVQLGKSLRAVAAKRGLSSVAAPEYAAPGVVVLYDPPVENSKSIVARFIDAGMQIAGGVPLMCGGDTDSQNDNFRTFRLGLFGLDKLHNETRTISLFEKALDQVLPSNL